MYAPGSPGDVIVQIARANRRPGSPAGVQTYWAGIYSQRSLPVSSETTDFPPLLRNLPLQGIERIQLDPGRYAEWLAHFMEGENALWMMGERLREALSPGLLEMLTRVPISIRVWWNSTAPELNEFPWELTVNPGRMSGEHRVALIRGLPPETPIPTMPSTRTPRLALIGPRFLWPRWAEVLANELADRAETFNGPVRESLTRAVESGVQLIHVFSDGIVSSALEGILYDHTATFRSELPPRELSNLLAGSHVAVMALSRSNDETPDVLSMAGRSVLSAYRAFSYIGSTTLPMPTVLAPVGPVPDDMMAAFWSTFYRELTKSWHLTESLRAAHARFPFSLPIALFCRHAGGLLFRPMSEADVKVQPMDIRSEILQSEAITQDLSRLEKKYKNLPRSVNELFQKERQRQSKLRQALDPWVSSGEDL